MSNSKQIRRCAALIAVYVVALTSANLTLAQSMSAISDFSLDSPSSQTPSGLSSAAPLIRTTSGSAIGLSKRISTGIEASNSPARFGSRGVRDVQNYRKYSPSVALIVTDTGIGSGFLISNEGLIVTNYHVIDDAKSIAVIFKPSVEGTTPTKTDAVSASVIRVDQKSDLALIKVSRRPSTTMPISLGSLANVSVGADVFAIGHPTGEAWTFTKGVVSQLRRDYRWRTESGIEHSATVIQTQTPINPGNSGGPLIDSETGVLVGVNSFKSDGEGLNYAVSVEDVRRILSAKESRYVKRPNTPPSAAATNTNCEPRTLSSGRSRADDSQLETVDLDCDGKIDAVLEIPDDRSKGLSLHFDSDGNGNVDVIIVDEDRDGSADFQLVDTNSDSRADVIGYYRSGESKPYRYEKIS